MKEAARRGLDVEQLHDSSTPAWRNLRGRVSSQPRNYYDGPADHDDDDFDESEGEQEEQIRPSVRARRSLQGYDVQSTDEEGEAKPRRPSIRSHALDHQLPRSEEQKEDDSDDDEEELPRYPLRQRRTTERFIPAQHASPGPARNKGPPPIVSQEEEEEEGKHNELFSQRYSVRDRKTTNRFNPSQKEVYLGKEGGESNRQYPLRDRSVRLQVSPQSRKRSRIEKSSRGVAGRSSRENGRLENRSGDDDDDDDVDLPHHGVHGPQQHVPSQPWELALTSVKPSAAIAHVLAPWLGSTQQHKATSADVRPLEVDTSLNWDQVGGLEHYIKALKEMIFLPLVYPELFDRFKISPPRGVLFYGPPGTGKTLVARALAAHASRAGKKVSFFMRKGADVLSKWVGEAERQLRLLFEEAQKNAPSIIFFDEIDGLAPVRSSKQDQIHNSIVSTLLALMDGLDSRGQVVIIGATNRVDALDGALRRPGRFDRELIFPLPNESARADILRIHTSKWATPPSAELIMELASYAVGYCGADLKGLCTEASLAALRRRYPQIYESEQKLLVNPEEVAINRSDFLTALTTITPASHRSAASYARPLPAVLAPLLLGQLNALLAQVQRNFPAAAACVRNGFGLKNPAASLLPGSGQHNGSVLRPRILIYGQEGSGQNHLGPALLYALEGLPVHGIGLPSLLSDAGARSAEEALVHAMIEARRCAPAIVYLPHLQLWWETAPASLRATLWTLLADLPSDLPLLLLATADCSVENLDMAAAAALFGAKAAEGYFEIRSPNKEERLAFFKPISEALALPQPPELEPTSVERRPPTLPVAPEAVAAEAARMEQEAHVLARKAYEEDQAALRALRMALREITMKLLRNRKWEVFWEPPSLEYDPEYWKAVAQPMDLATILARIDGRHYSTPSQYLADMALIPKAEEQLWRDDPKGYKEISRAHALEDEARTLVAATVPVTLRDALEAIAARGGPALPPTNMPEEKPLAVEGEFTNDFKRITRQRDAVDDWIVHKDPEVERRRILSEKKKAMVTHTNASQKKDVSTVQQTELPSELEVQKNTGPSPVVTEADYDRAEMLCQHLEAKTHMLNFDQLEAVSSKLSCLTTENESEKNREIVVANAKTVVHSWIQHFL